MSKEKKQKRTKPKNAVSAKNAWIQSKKFRLSINPDAFK